MKLQSFYLLLVIGSVLFSCKKEVKTDVDNPIVPFNDAPCELEPNVYMEDNNGFKNYINSDTIIFNNTPWTPNSNYLIKLYDTLPSQWSWDTSIPVFEIAFKSEPVTGAYAVVTNLDPSSSHQVAIYREWNGWLYRSLANEVDSIYVDNRSGKIRISGCNIYYDLDGNYQSIESFNSHKFIVTK
jgi:hypothetical protein